ncbi:MAG: DUF58 domain-containing protein [Candidatus Limnocylindrales bacterium]
MTAVLLGSILLVIVGSLVGIPVAVALGLFATILELIHLVWVRRGLENVGYRRQLATDRVAWGDEIPMTLEVWNRKAIPLPWLRADDETSPGVVVLGRAQELRSDPSGTSLRNTWTLAPYERVVRRQRILAAERGVFTIGPVTLTVGDLFARTAATEEREVVDTFLVRPRTVPTAGVARPERWGDAARTQRRWLDDPSRFAGVRPYQPGDPIRRIHARASARVGRPFTKRFESSRDREVLLLVDLQTDEAPSWQTTFDSDDVEALIVAAASVARALARDNAALGVAAAGYSGAQRRFAYLPVSSAPRQVERLLDVLARLSSHPSTSFDRLLEYVRRAAPAGQSLLVVTARDPGSYLAGLRGLQRAGFGVRLLACGAGASQAAATARRAGIAASTAGLDGPWRAAGVLTMVRG